MQEPYETALAEAEAMLMEARDLLVKEIREYPSPISGCDAQFNRLLSDRMRISSAINALRDRPFIPTPRVPEQNEAPQKRVGSCLPPPDHRQDQCKQ